MSSQTTIHPAAAVNDEWVLFSQTLPGGKLIVEYQIQPSGECAIPNGLTHHVLIFELGHVPRQVSRIGRQEYDDALLQGEILLIPAATPLFGACETADEVLVLSFDPAFLHQVALEAHYPHPEQIELLSLFKKRDLQIQSAVQSIYREMQQAKWGSGLYLDSLANLLAVHLLRNYTSQTIQPRQHSEGLGELRLKRVLDYIQAHLEQDIQLSDLAEAVDLSQCYFASLFKQSMGIAPWQYVMRQRVERAKTLIKQGNQSIAEIALQCGFTSQSHFTQQFRNVTGMTPKHYRDG
jgi:AraC family transcriptional regulator